MQDKAFIQAAIDEGQVRLVALLAESPKFDGFGCVPHQQLHLLGKPLVETLLQRGMSVDAREPGTRTFLLHKVCARNQMSSASASMTNGVCVVTAEWSCSTITCKTRSSGPCEINVDPA